jgi:arylsulfatase A-like enzyme
MMGWKMVRQTLPLMLILLLAGCNAAPKPNILVIVVDDLGWMDVGFNNPDTFYETPNLDRLASQGAVFTSAYSSSSVSSPTRASLLTGRHPVRLGMTDFSGARIPEVVLTRPNYPHPLLPGDYRKIMPLDEVSIAEALGEAGYRTFFAGKWAVGAPGYWPEDQGFDINKGGTTAGAPRSGDKYFSPYDNPRLEDGPAGEYLPNRLASETISFMSDSSASPFLAYLSFYSVHTPLMTLDSLVEKYTAKAMTAPADSFMAEGSRRTRMVQNHPVYAGMVESVDTEVGRVMDALAKSGKEDNTIVLFVSDNGGLSTSEGHPTSNAPLRAGKGWLYEGGLRVPMFVRWPGSSLSGTVFSEPVISTDLLPTILEMADVRLPRGIRIDGKSLVPTLQGAEGQERALWWHYPHYSHQGGPPASVIRRGNLKFFEYYEDGRQELYDVAADLEERNNLIEQFPVEAAELRQELFARLDSLDAKYPTLNPNRPGMLETVHERVVRFTRRPPVGS